jgi:FOG: Ankyrin repeat
MKEEKVDPDHIFGADGMPLLAWPVFTESPEGLRAMLENGADPNAATLHPAQNTSRFKGRHENNAMVWASQKEDAVYLQLLLDHGGDPNTRNSNGESLLFHALIHQNKQKNLKLLIERGARVNDLAGMGGTVLELYTSRGGFEISYWLLEHGADPSLVYEYGKPVHRWDSHMVQSMFWYPAPEISRDWQRKCQIWLLEHGYVRPPLSDQYREMRSYFGFPTSERDVPLPLAK